MRQLRWILILTVLVSAAPLTQSCSSQEKTTTVERTTTTPSNPQPQEAATTTTTTTTERSEKQPDSVLGASAHAIGTVILFPFRLIGDALGLLV